MPEAVASSEELNHVNEQLQSEEQRQLLDTIDELRSEAIKDVNLPQLIVCGDQTSGKSSVLNAITRLSFPWHENVCTTFATEIILRRGAAKPSKVRIMPGPSRTEEQQKELEKFEKTFEDNAGFHRLFDEARECMRSMSKAGEKTIFDDKLRIHLTGPSHTTLTVVDLPGIIHNPNEGQNDDDLTRINELVHSYMKNPRSIILAIISAENTIELQKILSMAREEDIDPRALRTFGIITKPDLVKENPDFKKAIMDLARNERKRYHLSMGWHVVRNRSFKEVDSTDAQRDEAERKFFEEGEWASHPREWVGVNALCRRLQRYLLHQIRLELPALVGELEDRKKLHRVRLEKLGESRESPKELRAYLTGIGQQFQTLTKSAINGNYENRFFDISDINAHNTRRLCAILNDCSEAFINAMQEKGHRWHIIEPFELKEDARDIPQDLYYRNIEKPQHITWSQMFDKVKTLRNRSSRRSLLPDTFNEDAVKELFHLQARNWGVIATCYITSVCDIVQNFIQELLAELTDSETAGAILHEQIEPFLGQKRKDLGEKIEDLLSPSIRKYPIIYNPGLRGNPFKVKDGNSDTDEESDAEKEYDPDLETITEMGRYFQLTMTIFINNVASLAIEACFLDSLPDVCSPMAIHDLSDEMLQKLAGESDDVKINRRILVSDLRRLEKGLELLRPQMSMAKREAKTREEHAKEAVSDQEAERNDRSVPGSEAAAKNQGPSPALANNKAAQPPKPASGGLFAAQGTVPTPKPGGLFAAQGTVPTPASGGLFAAQGTVPTPTRLFGVDITPGPASTSGGLFGGRGSTPSPSPVPVKPQDQNGNPSQASIFGTTFRPSGIFGNRPTRSEEPSTANPGGFGTAGTSSSGSFGFGSAGNPGENGGINKPRKIRVSLPAQPSDTPVNFGSPPPTVPEQFQFPKKGEHPTYVLPPLHTEKEGAPGGKVGTGLYQSVTANSSLIHLSFEELRLRDYNAAKTYRNLYGREWRRKVAKEEPFLMNHPNPRTLRKGF